MSEWIPFDEMEPVHHKSYFVTLKSHPNAVKILSGSNLIGANNVLAVMEIETPNPYIPPKRREIWYREATGEVWYKPNSLGDHYRQVFSGDPEPQAVARVIAEMCEAVKKNNVHMGDIRDWLLLLEAPF